MKRFFYYKTISCLFIIIGAVTRVHAASLVLDAPNTASSNRESFPITVYLDPGSDTVGAVSADLSFPEDTFEVKSISTQNSVVSLWANAPHTILENRFDQRTHIAFEGAIIGGFSGVVSAYDKKKFPGILFTVELIPKNQGNADIVLNNIEVHAYDENGTTIDAYGDKKMIRVPVLSNVTNSVTNNEYSFVQNQDIGITLASSSLIGNGSLYLFLTSNNPAFTIDHIDIAESSIYKPDDVVSYEWRSSTNPYLLTYRARSKYIHAKIFFTNKTYTYITLPPVENLQSFSLLSRILICITIVILLLYLYGKNFLHVNQK